MILQISSARGPSECELAVALYYNVLKEEYPEIEMLSFRSGLQKDTFSSIVFKSSEDLSHLVGSTKWVFQSPYRPNHKRKNWFVNISLFNDITVHHFDESDLRYDCFRSGGKGGQNVNKTDTGVRITHVSSEFSITSTAERSQYLNKKDALEKMRNVFKEINEQSIKNQEQEVWSAHNNITRGNSVRVYKGIKSPKKVEEEV